MAWDESLPSVFESVALVFAAELVAEGVFGVASVGSSQKWLPSQLETKSLT